MLRAFSGSERVDARHLEARARHDGREHHVGDAGCSLDAGLLLLKVRHRGLDAGQRAKRLLDSGRAVTAVLKKAIP